GALWLHALVMLPALADRPTGNGSDAAAWQAATRATRGPLINQAGWGLVGSVVAAIALLAVQATAGARRTDIGAIASAAATMLVGRRFGVFLQLRLLLLVIVAFALWAAVVRRPPTGVPTGAGRRSGRSLGIVATGGGLPSAAGTLNLFWPFILTVSAWAMLTV